MKHKYVKNSRKRERGKERVKERGIIPWLLLAIIWRECHSCLVMYFNLLGSCHLLYWEEYRNIFLSLSFQGEGFCVIRLIKLYLVGMSWAFPIAFTLTPVGSFLCLWDTVSHFKNVRFTFCFLSIKPCCQNSGNQQSRCEWTHNLSMVSFNANCPIWSKSN